MTKRGWLIVFVVWRAALCIAMMAATVAMANWKASILMFMSGGLAVDTAYIVDAARREFPAPRRKARR